MKFEREFSADPEISEKEIAHTVRVVPIRINSKRDVLYDILLATNSPRGRRDGLSNAKSGKFEVPGGKVHVDEEDRVNFAKLSHRETQEALLLAAARELEEETGVYLNPTRFRFLGTKLSEIEGTYSVYPNASYYQTTYYAVVLDESEYQGDLPKHWTAQLDSDDAHSERGWEPIGQDMLDEEMLEGLFVPKTVDILAQSDVINEAVTQEMRQTQARLAEALKKVNSVVTPIEGVSILTHSSGFRESKLSVLDLTANLRPLPNQDFVTAYEKHFEVKLDVPEIQRARQILLDQCVANVVAKSREIDQLTKEEADELQVRFFKACNRIKSPSDLHRFFNWAAGNKVGRRVIRSFLGYGKIAQLDYFPYIDSESRSFNKKLEDTLVDKKFLRAVQSKNSHDPTIKRIRDFNGNPCFLALDANTKTLERMVAKSSIKVEVNPRRTGDVYRARIITETVDDMDGIKTFLEAKLGSPTSAKSDSWQLAEKSDYSTSLMRDPDRSEIKLLGSFPVERATVRIPVEIQIMTREEYERSESGANFHPVYSELLQGVFEETRPVVPISESYVEEKIQELSQNQALIDSYVEMTGKTPDALAHKARRDITARLNQHCFELSNGDYLAYQHVIRCMDAPDLVAKEDETFFAMSEALNGEIGCKMFALHWRDFFVNPIKAIQTHGLKRIGVHFFKFLEAIETKKFGINIDTSELETEFLKAVNAACNTRKDLLFWSKLLQAPHELTKSDKKYIANNRAKLKDGLKGVCDFQLDTLYH